MPTAFAAAGRRAIALSDVLAPEIDAVLHRERFASGKKLHRLPMPIAKLPDGTMLQAGGDSFLVVQGRALKWSPAGYGRAARLPDDAMLLTPPSAVRAFAAGYRPVLHESAQHL